MRTRRIVVGVDGSEGSYRALNWCVDLANDLDAEIIAVHSFESPIYMAAAGGIPFVYDDGQWRNDIKEAFEKEWCGPLRGATGVKFRTELIDGNPAHGLMSIADGEDADMIVVGARGRGGFTELLLGSVSHQVAHHSKRPVVIIPAE